MNKMPSYSHENRQLTLVTPLGKNAVLINGFTGREAISSLTELELEILSVPENPIKPAFLIGKRVTLGISYKEVEHRYFNGIVRSLELVGQDSTLEGDKTPVLIYKATVVPSLWLLTLNAQSRVFQNLTVIEIVKNVLDSYYITSRNDTEAAYEPLDYCTQYRETDYDFVTRLMEQHGIFFYFTHTENDHVMLLADNSGQLAPCPVKNTYQYMPEMRDDVGDMYLHYFGVRSALVTGKHTLWEYRFTQFARQESNPPSSSSKAALGDNNHEWYDYADGPSAWAKTDASDGRIQEVESQLQDVARDRSDREEVKITGNSNASLLMPGFTFTMEKHPDSALNSKYLVLSVEHNARQEPPFCNSTMEPGYRNIFTAQPGALVYRPARTTPKPRVHGVVTGKVVTPKGEDSYIDKYGRVCVQFWWDRTRPPNQTDNTLLRVAQAWAGSGWGTYFWPRVNDEVLIDFIEGDPDAPIVVGSLYNGVNKPKYDPATESTRSGVLTRSSKGGGAANANELRFEDKAGSEQIFLNAEKDMDHRVEKDHRQYIGGKDSLVVKGGRYDDITGDRDSNVSGYRAENVARNYSLSVGGDHAETVKNNYSLIAESEVYIKAGTTLIIESGLEICLKTETSAIIIGPAGVTISGAMIMAPGLGSSFVGTAGTIMTPEPPDEADDGTRGGKM
jgi:type VI secretion system secreted protein VgrG